MSDFSVLLVHDNPLIIGVLSALCERKACPMRHVDNMEGALACLSESDPDLILMELSSPKIAGPSLLKEIKKRNAEAPVWIVSGEREPERIIEAWRLGADEFLASDEIAEIEQRLTVYLENRKQVGAGKGKNAGHPILDNAVLSMMMIMSHDIRSPIMSIGAMVKLLRNGSYGRVEGRVQDGLDELYARVLNLSGVVEDYLSRIALLDGNEFLIKEELNIHREIIEPVLTEFSHDIRMFSIRFDNRLDARILGPLSVQANRQCMKAVFRNLLSNAIKYGGRGCTIRLEFEDAGNQCRFSVFNSGEPIPARYRDMLFTRFGKIRKKDRAALDGMGIGLFLVKNILREHGGDIRYEGEADGSSFVFTLPKSGQICTPCTRVESAEPPCGMKGTRRNDQRYEERANR